MLVTSITYAHGTAEGLAEDGVRRFLSLPYAAPLTQDRRLREPQPVEPWQGVRDATAPGPSAPQPVPPEADIDLSSLMGPKVEPGPDYLTLNIFTPEGDPSNLPVMVFIHGGSFIAGSKDVPIYDGRAFARDGAVCVVINYRVGIEGFLPIPGVPTNLGLRDMIAALHWVRDHVAAFGGDPANVTLFGESGGAWCIAGLMASPLAAGLFRRAICQSGHAYGARPNAVMQRLVNRLAKRLKIPATREGFLSKTPEEMLPALEWVMKPNLFFDMRDETRRDPTFGITRFMMVHGDDVLPLPPLEALKAGASRDVELLIGTTSEEARLFFVPGNAIAKIRRWMARLFLHRALPNATKALQAYGLDEKGAKPGEVLACALTDLMFRAMTRRTAELHQGRSHVYEFEWRSPALGGELGAAHAIELPFVFDTLACASGPNALLGESPPQELATSIHSLWIRFAAGGTLPWAPFEPDTREVWSLTCQVAGPERATPAAAFLP